ncbi:hypothetical protein F383_33090 [Gossypium arboreum]|uniref:Uncharacterized protein n=1 Tax=Gossypium arboreum TaxID=29729 RepID=A0A0B0N548_GOSAR|nr:hypothetical protein F383_33090 [Gossypium arboreum]
MKICMTIY